MKWAIILGASGDIGSETARKLAEDGWSIYLHYAHNYNRVEKLREELVATFPDQQFLLVQADFTQEEAADQLADQLFSIQAIVVANGHELLKLLTETTIEEMNILWRVHGQNPIRFIGRMSEQMRQHKRSYIVFVGSIWGTTGAANEVVYSTVKGAQHAFVRAYAKESASSGIRVNGIAPGWIETRMNEQFDEEEKEMAKEIIPLQEIGKPSDVAEVVRFLLSGRADYMTGQILNVNGGWFIG